MRTQSQETVPTARFDSRQFRPEERLAAFQRFTRSIYDVRAVGDPERFTAKALGYRVGDLVFNQVDFSAAWFRRGARHLRGGGKDFVAFDAQLTGEQSLVMDRGHIRMLPGHIYLRDWAHGFESVTTAMTLNSIIIPRNRLEASASMSAHTPVISWSMTAPAGRMLAALWAGLLGELAQVSLPEAENLAEAFLRFADGLLGPGAGEPLPATRGAMQQFLAARLRGDVGVDDLCKHFHASRSTVYRLFQPDGGIQQYINRMRLERCYAELRRADPKKMTVSEIASSWGFYDASSFTRRFRARFGVPPSRVLGASFTPESEAPVKDRVAHARLFQEYMAWLESASGTDGRSTGSPS